MAKKINERLTNVKTHNPKIDRKFDDEMIIAVEKAKKKVSFDLPSNPQQGEQLKKSIMEEIINKRVKENTISKQVEAPHIGHYAFELDNLLQGNKKFYNVFPALNEEYIINQAFYKDLKPVVPKPKYGEHSRRVGVLGFKVGMMSTFDMWGYHTPLTVIQIDRCQIVQHRDTADPNIVAVQVGGGHKSLRTITKAEIGHYLKNNLVANTYLKEFKVSRENLLPVGFRLGARHFTPGQFVDVRAVAKDKGVQGAMKKWGFGGQPASHGVSVSHRSLGSTGQNQDPSKVIKGKKMHGYMGGHTRVQYNLKVFRVDHDRCLVYLLGSIPGKAGELIEIQDARFKPDENFELVNFPTFLPEEGKSYASITQVEPPLQDPSEVWLHDNVLPKDDEKDDDGPTTTGADAELDD
jgi:large subunit ribosomal protein L3